MKKTILLSIVFLTVILAFNFSTNISSTHSVQFCYHRCPGVMPAETKVIIRDGDNKEYGICTMQNRDCCKLDNIPDGIYHAYFTQDGTSYCDTQNFTIIGDDKIVYLPCLCR